MAEPRDMAGEIRHLQAQVERLRVTLVFLTGALSSYLGTASVTHLLDLLAKEEGGDDGEDR